MKSKKPLRLNLGSGDTKIDGYVNIDVNAALKPDLVHNFITEQLPYKDNTVDEIIFFHCIEHIRKIYHRRILAECWRVLKPKSRIIISYPEFTKCYKNWKTNYRGKKDFWEATMFGRQSHAADFHVCPMNTPDFQTMLLECGFTELLTKPEILELHNTTVTGIKGLKSIDYETMVKDSVTNLKFKRIRQRNAHNT